MKWWSPQKVDEVVSTVHPPQSSQEVAGLGT